MSKKIKLVDQRHNESDKNTPVELVIKFTDGGERIISPCSRYNVYPEIIIVYDDVKHIRWEYLRNKIEEAYLRPIKGIKSGIGDTIEFRADG